MSKHKILATRGEVVPGRKREVGVRSGREKKVGGLSMQVSGRHDGTPDTACRACLTPHAWLDTPMVEDRRM